jgi:hypothetical protein
MAAESNLDSPNQKLINGLIQISGRKYEDPLECAYDSLRLVVAYTETISQVDQLHSIAPLRSLINAISDRLQGGSPILFKPRPKQGPPKNQSFSMAQGALAGCMEVLVKAGMSQDDAVLFVTTKASAFKITDRDGQPVTRKNVKSWRARAGEDLPASGLAVFRKITEIGKVSETAAKNHVLGVLRAVKDAALTKK